MDELEYHARWAALHATSGSPAGLARLDLRLEGAPPIETRLLFDVLEHREDLRAAVRSERVALVTSERLRRTRDISPGD